jgi:hypothetical protein
MLEAKHHFKKPCQLWLAKEMVCKATHPIDWLSDDNYSCSRRAGISLGGRNAKEPRMKSGAVFTSFQILI